VLVLLIACSDHVTVGILLSLLVAIVSTHLYAHNQRYLWHCADYDLMCEYLSTIDWSNVVCYNPEVSYDRRLKFLDVPSLELTKAHTCWLILVL